MKEKKPMTANEKCTNKFPKDGFVLRSGRDEFSRMRSIMDQMTHKIEEKKRLAREEEAKKRASKKNKGGEAVNG